MIINHQTISFLLRDVDELSELSEHNSYGSLEFSSSTSSDEEEDPVAGPKEDQVVSTGLPSLEAVDARVASVRRDDSFRSDVSSSSNASARQGNLAAKVEFGQKEPEYTEAYASYVDKREKPRAAVSNLAEEHVEEVVEVGEIAWTLFSFHARAQTDQLEDEVKREHMSVNCTLSQDCSLNGELNSVQTIVFQP